MQANVKYIRKKEDIQYKYIVVADAHAPVSINSFFLLSLGTSKHMYKY